MRTFIKTGLVLCTGILVLIPDVVLACEHCFGANVDTPVTQGISLAMMSLLGVVATVGFGIVMFFNHVRKRTIQLEPGSLVVNEYGEIRDTNLHS